MPSALSFLNTTWSSNYYPIKVVVYAQVCSNFAVWQEELLFAQYYSIVVKSFGQCCSLLSSGKKSLLTSKKRKSVCALGAIVKAPSLPVPVCSSSGVYKQGAIDVTRQLWRVMMRIGGHHYHCQYQYLPLSYTTLSQSSLRQSIYEPLHHYFGVCVYLHCRLTLHLYTRCSQCRGCTYHSAKQSVKTCAQQSSIYLIPPFASSLSGIVIFILELSILITSSKTVFCFSDEFSSDDHLLHTLVFVASSERSLAICLNKPALSWPFCISSHC